MNAIAKSLFVAGLGFFMFTSSASAQQVITITDPVTDEIWTTGNPQSVTFSYTQGYSSGKVVFFAKGSPTVEYATIHFGPNPGSSPVYVPITSVPSTGNLPGAVTDVTIKVTVYDIMGNPTSGEKNIKIKTPN